MMKKNTLHLLSMLTIAALLTLLTIACTGDELDPPFSLSTPKGASKVHVSVGAGISDDATRSTVDYTSGTRTLKFTAGDKLYVSDVLNVDMYGKISEVMAGFLTVKDGSISADGTSAQFEGDLDCYRWDTGLNKYMPFSPSFITSDPLTERQQAYDEDCLPDGVHAQLVHEGTESNFNVADIPEDRYFTRTYEYSNKTQLSATVDELLTQRLELKANRYDAENHCFHLAIDDEIAIFHCTLSGLPAGKTFFLTISRDSRNYGVFRTQTDATGVAQFALLYPEADWGTEYTYTFTLTNTADNTDTYSFSVGPVTLQKKVYNISRHWSGLSFEKKLVNLSTVISGYLAEDGETLTGTYDCSYALWIEDGATVTLENVTMDAPAINELFGCIQCTGDAHIILNGTNVIKPDISCPGIEIKPGKTLTISGTGSLDVTGGEACAAIGGGDEYSGIGGNIVITGGTITAHGGNRSPGIGSNSDGIFGNITITGGTVNATGGGDGAGIGTGYEGTCGDIIISGGTVNATGGQDAAGIGTGYYGTCGNITITSGVTHVTATTGGHLTNISIGAGWHGTCGTITIESPSKVTEN